jgi:DNA-methyltransferase (dcm)
MIKEIGCEDIFILQLKEEFKKIVITDDSINLVSHENRIVSYFYKKIQHEIENYRKVKNLFEFTDLFSGAGGLSLGLEQENFISKLAIDKDESALKTYHFNRPYLEKKQIINEDIRVLIKDFTFDHTPLIVGGPPCQGFSNANKQRKKDDARNKLYKLYVQSVKQAKPDIFLLENVEGILTHIDEIKSDFNKIKYTLYPYILNTKDFGFPQHRKRAFILGINNKHKSIFHEIKSIFDNTLKSEKNKISFSLWNAIYDMPALEAKTKRNDTYSENKLWGYTFGNFFELNSPYSKLININNDYEIPLLNHKSKYNNERDIEIYRLLSPGEKSNSESIKDINPYKNRDDIFKDKFFKLQPNEPCKTITAHMYYDCHMYIHPYSARGLTPREAARIQGFPDDYLFLGSPNEWYRQIGNAVSPLMARVLGKSLYNVLRRIYRQ